MNPRRCIHFEPTEVSLSFLLLTWMASAVPLISIGIVLVSLIMPREEMELKLRLHTAGSAERLSNRSKSSEMFIQEDGTVFFNNSVVDLNTDKRLPSLRKLVRAYMRSPDAATTVVFVEDQATFERVIDVLNVFKACDYTNCRFVFLTEPIVGPRLPRKDDFNPNATPSPMQEYLRSLRSGF